MISHSSDNEQQTTELLADRATFGLSRNEEHMLVDLLPHGAWRQADSMDLAAAAVYLTDVAARLEPMPHQLGRQVRTHAHHVVAHASRFPISGLAVDLGDDYGLAK